jgi:hypothetical protein
LDYGYEDGQFSYSNHFPVTMNQGFSFQPETIDATIGVFACPPTIVKFQPQLLKT